MSELLSIGGLAPPASGRLGNPLPDLQTASPPEDAGLSLRFDDELQRVLAQTSFRMARTRAIRAEIDAGNYETPERIRGTVDRLLDLLG